MDPEPEGVVKVGEPCQEDDCPVPGIHIEVEQDLQVVQNRRADIVGLVDNDDRRLPFFQRQTVDLILDDPEIVRLPVGGDAAELKDEVPVEIIQCQGRKAAVDDLVQRRVHLPRPVPDDGRLPAPGPAGQEPEALRLQEISEPEGRLPVLLRLDQDLFGVLEERVELQPVS